MVRLAGRGYVAFLGELNDFLYDPGAGSAGFLKDALAKTGDFACQLYKGHPGAFTLLDPFGFRRGFWDEMCKPRPPGLPPPPSRPYTGGQCNCVAYSIRVTYSNIYGSGHVASFGARGPITSVTSYTEKIPGSNHYVEGVAIGCRGGNSSACGSPTVIRHGLSSGDPSKLKVTGVQLTRVDGQSDNCGNLPSGYPPETLTESERSTTIIVNHDDGTSVSVPVLINPALANVDFDLNVPLTINLGGLHFYLNADGFHSGPPGGALPPDAKKDVEDIKDKLDDVTNPPNPDEDPRLTPTFPPVADSGEEDDLSGARWIKVDLTTLPDKAQYSRGGRPVYFAGWLEFHKGGYALPRMQINYQKTIFRFPDGADGYSYTFTNGAAGAVTVYTEQEEEDG